MESSCDDDNNLRNMGSVSTFVQGRQSHIDELSNGILRVLVEVRIAEGFSWSAINSFLWHGLDTLSFDWDSRA